MDCYLDLQILADPEFSTTQLMNALFAKLHRCLVQLGTQDIGVSFPGTNEAASQLGRVLRLHASHEGFARVMAQPWLTGMRDHLRIAEVKAVPASVPHCQVRRVQAKSNPERIRRRQMKRHGWHEQEARARVPDSCAKLLKLPYLVVDSQSSQHRFRLFLRHQPATAPVAGAFNAYGLSTVATVPWF